MTFEQCEAESTLGAELEFLMEVMGSLFFPASENFVLNRTVQRLDIFILKTEANLSKSLWKGL